MSFLSEGCAECNKYYIFAAYNYVSLNNVFFMKKVFLMCLVAMTFAACGGGSKEDKAKKEMKEAIEAVKEAAEEKAEEMKETVEDAAKDAEKEAKKALEDLKK